MFVTEPYLELHTGAGRGYPVFNVVARDASVQVLFRRTDWFKVRTERGVEGWASQRDMLKTVLADGTPVYFRPRRPRGLHLASLRGRRFPWSLGWREPRFHVHLVLVQFAAGPGGSVGNYLGKFTNGVTGDIGLAHVVWPEWRVSPFFMIGTGIEHIEPKATLVQPQDRVEQTAYVGAGVRFYLTRRFFVRAEFKSHYIFTNLNQNRESRRMETGIRVLLLTVALAALSGCATVQQLVSPPSGGA